MLACQQTLMLHSTAGHLHVKSYEENECDLQNLVIINGFPFPLSEIFTNLVYFLPVLF